MENDCEKVPEQGVVNIEDPVQRRYWAGLFNVSEPVLVHAVKLVGPAVAQLREILCPD